MFLRWITAIFFILTPALLSCDEIDLSKYGKKIYSQTEEDGILEKIFQLLGIEKGFCVEFGADDGYELSNTLQFRNQGWDALLLDNKYQNPEISLYKEWITRENALQIFEKYEVPEEFELMSIDIDSNDWYVWNELGKVYRPKVVIIEYNYFFGPNDDRIIEYHPKRTWDHSAYYGASFVAYFRLGQKLDYSLVYATRLNAVFVRNDLLKEKNLVFKNQNDVSKLYKGHVIPHESLKHKKTKATAEIFRLEGK